MEESVTVLIGKLREGDRAALDRLMPLIYAELRRMAAGYLRDEPAGQTLQPTALVHEAYIRMVGSGHPDYLNRAHFFGVAARIMREILVDHARSRNADKRGGNAVKLPLAEELDFSAERSSVVLALDDALHALAAIDENKARLVELRFFAGMTAEEISEFLSTSVHQVRYQLRMALAWLHREVTRPPHRMDAGADA